MHRRGERSRVLRESSSRVQRREEQEGEGEGEDKDENDVRKGEWKEEK